MSAIGIAARRTGGRLSRTGGKFSRAGRLAGVPVKGSPVPVGRTASVLLASEGRPFSNESVLKAAALAAQDGGSVVVMSTARVHGTSMGLPAPGLAPTPKEWEEQRAHVEKAVRLLRKRGVAAEGQVFGTRKPAQRICAMASEVGADAIVMGADADRGRMVGSMLWSQEPQHVARRAPASLAVHLVA